MMAAITAAERGHDVTLHEKGDALGGALRHAEGVAFKQDLHRFKEYLVRRVDALPIKVILGSEATPESEALCQPDVLMVSVGAAPVVPCIPGEDRGSVILAADAHSPEAAVGAAVVVVGGGQVGCETALHLAENGKKVTIVEMLDEVAADANVFHRTSLLLELEKAVEVRTGLTCVEITEEGVTAVDRADQLTTLPCDTVVLAVGYRPRGDVVDCFRSAAPEVIPIGDCVKPQKVQNAVRTGYDAAMTI